MQQVFIVSDGTGRTCEQVVRSALVQFENAPIALVVRPRVRRKLQIRQVVREAAEAKAILLYTLVSPGARQTMRDAGQEHLVETVDVLGPVLSGLNSLLRRSPRATPGLYYESERDYFDRVDAIDYTLKHDDGQRLQELTQADVVLVGVSRASKSSTCFYLAYRGVFAANVPLLPDRAPPRELTRLDKRRVVGLSMSPRRLHAVRLARAHALGIEEEGTYLDYTIIVDEVRAVHEQMARHGWSRIDVSHLAIEEIAREVMHRMEGDELKPRRRRRRQPRST